MALETEDVRDRLDEIVGTWETKDREIELSVREHHMLGVIVFGLTSHCHHLARGIRALDREGLQLAAMPLVRQLIECAVTVLWVDLYGLRAVRASMREHAQNREKTLMEFVRTGADIEDETSRQAAEYVAALDDEARAAGRNFRERCEDIDGGLRMYAFWRIASGDCHASTAVADHYLHETPQARAGLTLSTDPKPGAWDAWLGTSLTMLVLASLAADRFDKTRRRRTRLKEIAREVGTVTAWNATAVGLKRQSQWERKHRAAARGNDGAAVSGP